MSFLEVLKEKKSGTVNFKNKTEINETQEKSEELLQGTDQILENKDALELLRTNNVKVRLVTPTSFGTQIDFAKKYDKEVIQEILKDYTIKIKNKSVFVIN